MESVITEPDLLTEEEIQAVAAELVDTDGEPMESPWHRAEIGLLIETIVWHWRGRTDYFVGGNMFIYFSLSYARQKKYKGPDFFLAKGVDGTRDRRYWWVFEEDGKYPDAIVELLSPTTAHDDLTTKKKLYEKTFKTHEYFCYDPETKKLQGWRLIDDRYQPIRTNDKGWLWCEELELFLGTWDGVYLEKRDTWLRFFDEKGTVVLVKAESEEQRADQLGSELAKIKTLLAEKGIELESEKKRNHRPKKGKKP